MSISNWLSSVEKRTEEKEKQDYKGRYIFDSWQLRFVFAPQIQPHLNRPQSWMTKYRRYQSFITGETKTNKKRKVSLTNPNPMTLSCLQLRHGRQEKKRSTLILTVFSLTEGIEEGRVDAVSTCSYESKPLLVLPLKATQVHHCQN